MWFQRSLLPTLVAIRIRMYESCRSQSPTGTGPDVMHTQTIEFNRSGRSVFIVRTVETEAIVILIGFAERGNRTIA
jgi:hypothetical protein